MRHLFRALALAVTVLAAPLAAQEQGGSDPVFQRDVLNAGLSPRPPTLDVATPQTALETFLDAAADERWTRAAHVLDLTDIPAAEQAEAGPDLARQLYSVIERKVVVRWSDLPERPDGLIELGSSDNPMVGVKRRSLSLGIVELNDRPVSIRLNRVQTPTGDPVWLFSPQTVDNVPALHAEHGPSALETSIPPFLRVEAVGGLRLWEVLFLPVAFVLIAATGIATWRFLGARAAARSGHLGRRILEGARLPATVAVTSVLLSWLTTELLVVSSLASAVLQPAILLGYVAACVILVINVIDALLERVVDTDPHEMANPERADERALATGISGLRRAVLVIAVLTGAGIILTSASVFRSLGVSLLASAGVLTLVLGFAAREVLGNIMASLQISLNRSARIGDQVIFDGRWCTVERVHFTFVQLKIWTGNRLVVPVSRFVSEPFENWSLDHVRMIRPVALKLGHEADVGRLRERFERLVAEDDRIAPKEDAGVYVVAHDAFGMDVRFNVPVSDPNVGWDVECAMREKLLAAARELGIAFPDDVARMDAA